MNNTNPSITEKQLRLVVRDEVGSLIRLHASTCQFVVDEHPARLRSIERRTATLLGLMIGSGILGGASSVALTKIFG